MQEIPEPDATEMLTPEQRSEFVLGAPFAPDQVHALLDYARHTITVEDYSPDAKKAFLESVINHETDVYDPLVGLAVLGALSDKYEIIEGLDLDNAEECAAACADEKTFQQVISIGFVDKSEKALKHAELYKVVAGQERFETALDTTLTKWPGMILSGADKLTGALSKDRAKDYLEADLMSMTAGERSLPSRCITPELVESLGKKRVQSLVDTAVASGDMLVPGDTNSTEIEALRRAGLLSDDESFNLLLDNFKHGPIDIYDVTKAVQKSENPETLQQVRKAFLEVVSNDDTVDLSKVEGIVRTVSSSWEMNYDPEFAKQVVSIVRSKHGSALLIDSVSMLEEILPRSEVQEIYDAALQRFDQEADMTDAAKKNLLIDLSRSMNKLDYADFKKVVDVARDLDPEFFLQQIGTSGKLGREPVPEKLSYIRQTVEDILPDIPIDTVLNNLIHFESDMLAEGGIVFDLVHQKLDQATSMFLLGDKSVQEFLGPERYMTLTRSVVRNAAANDDLYYLEASLQRVMKNIGSDAAKQLIHEMVPDSPNIAVALLREGSVLFDETEIGTMVDVAISSGQLDQIIGRMDRLVYRIPKNRLYEIGQTQIVDHPERMGGLLSDLAKVLEPGEIEELANEWMHANPAAVLRYWKDIPEGVFTDKHQVIEYIGSDSRSDLMPKYFKRTAKKLVAADESTAFAILAREATSTYAKIARIQSLDGGQEMFERLRDAMPQKSERSELDALSYATIAALFDVDPSSVNSLMDAKRVVVARLNERFGDAGLNLDASDEGVARLETEIGDILPVATYVLSMPDRLVNTSEYMAVILNNAAKGSFKEWKYGDREYLASAGVLPPVSERQYKIWQQNNTVTSSEIHATGASDVANHIQRVMRQNAGMIKGLEKLAEVSEPQQLISEAKADIREIGQQIAEVHKARARGDIEEHAAAEELVGLQRQKDELQYAVNVVKLTHISADEIAAGTIFSDSGKATTTTIDSVLQEVVERNGEAGLDALGQIQAVLDTFREDTAVDIGKVTISDVDDFQTTIEVGANPVGSCQHYEFGMYRQGLVGYFEPTVKVVTVANQRGRYIARAAVRLVHGNDGQPALVMEPLYTSQASDDIAGAVMDHVKAKADAMKVPLYVHDGNDSRGVYTSQGTVSLHRQRAPFLYSDVFGGVRSYDSTEPQPNTRKLTQL